MGQPDEGEKYETTLKNIDWAFFSQKYFGETVSDYLWFAGIVLGTLLLKRPVAALLARVSSRMASRFSYVEHKVTISNLLFKPLERLLQTVLYFVAINRFSYTLNRFAISDSIGRSKPINLKLGDVIDHVFIFLFIVFLAQVITHFFDFFYYLRINKANEEKDLARKQLLPLFKEVSKILVWILAVFSVMGYVFHVNVPALVTGLGIGGVAIALAGKETVENFLASFIILSDKPFQTGETIRMGDADGLGPVEGVVERIGFRSTRLRHVDGYTLIIPNQKLVSKNIINLSVRDTRSFKITANIKYGLTAEALEQLIARLKEALLATPPVIAPVDVSVEGFDTGAFQLVVTYNLPTPLPDGANLNAVKQEVSFKVFGIINGVADKG